MSFRISSSLGFLSLTLQIALFPNAVQAACDPVSAQSEFELLYSTLKKIDEDRLDGEPFPQKEKLTEQYIGRVFSKNAMTCYLKQIIPTSPLTPDQALLVRKALTTLVLEAFRNGIERTRILKQIINDDILENTDPKERFLAAGLFRSTFFIFLYWNSHREFQEVFENFMKLEPVAGLDIQKEFESMKIPEWLLSDLLYTWKMAISTSNRLSHSSSRQDSSTRKRFDEKHARLEDMKFAISSLVAFRRILLKGVPFPVASAIDPTYLPSALPLEEIEKFFSLAKLKNYRDSFCPNCKLPISFFDLEEKRMPTPDTSYSTEGVSVLKKPFVLCSNCEKRIAFNKSSSQQTSTEEKAPIESELKRQKSEHETHPVSDLVPVFPVFLKPENEYDFEMPDELPDSLPKEFWDLL